MAGNDDLENELNSIGDKPDLWRDRSGNVVDRNVAKATKARGLTMIRSDRTNNKVAKINIALTIAILFATLVQIIIMLRGK